MPLYGTAMSPLLFYRLKSIFAAIMDIRCTDKELFYLKKIASAAAELGIETYLVAFCTR